jgi:hypothetical protein
MTFHSVSRVMTNVGFSVQTDYLLPKLGDDETIQAGKSYILRIDGSVGI